MTDDELLHPIAVHVDILGHRREIRADDLKDETILNDAVRYAENDRLFDWSGGARLCVKPGVKGKVRAHFAVKSGTPLRALGRPRSQKHDGLIQQLILNLRTPPPKAGAWNWTNANGEISILRGYDWQTEVIRTIGPGVIARHDIFGHTNSFYTSPYYPIVKIEVIDTHYLEYRVFEALKALTRQIPMVVMFATVSDSKDASKQFLRFDHELNEIHCLLFLQNGQIWSRESLNSAATKTLIQTAFDLEKHIKLHRPK